MIELSKCNCEKEASSDCNECNHKLNSNCQIHYCQNFWLKTLPNEKIAEKGKQLQIEEERAAYYVEKEEERGTALDKEEAQTKTVLARFSVYLAANSVTAYNDSVLTHLDTLIEVAKYDPDKTQY